ncbi:MAG: hypothetical protein J6U36_07795 [Oscillospiraceae bacterium]|nr:hypothetical protein [Oscillospiraceae bacterium]
MNDNVYEVDAGLVALLIAQIIILVYNVLSGLFSLYERVRLKKEQNAEITQKSDDLNMDKNKEDLVDWKLINDPGREKVHRFIECSSCGMGVDVSSYKIQEVKEVFNFCPCCGQRMKLEVEWGQCSICKNLAKCWKERIARDGGRYCQQYEIIDSKGDDDNL